MSTGTQPIQFIEGVNEGATPIEKGFINVQGYPWVAIQYSPNLTFSLNRIDICLVWSKFIESVEYDVQLYSDYDDNPTDIILSEGKLVFDATESDFGWRSIELNQPAVIVSKKKYWIGLESKQALYAFMSADKGSDVAMRRIANNIWSSGEEDLYKFMLRFYGRVLQISD